VQSPSMAATGVLDGLPSVGSALHAMGMCRPCAWFWKPQGCQNAQECHHCHLCPEGEIKARKKSKLSLVRQDKEENEEGGTDEMEVKDDDSADSFEEREGMTQEQQPKDRGFSPTATPFLPQASLLGTNAMPSVGSTLHGTGMCRPCAWFWKQQGCENGQECRHCHLCSEGEIKARRKMKVAVIRTVGEMEEGLLQQAMQQVHYEQQQFMQWEEAAAVAMSAEAFEAVDGTPVADGAVGQEAFGDTLQFPPFEQAPVPLDLSASIPTPLPQMAQLPSTGSALHSLGKCRPCAWLWKPQGCLNGQECAHCHLCPQGELKVRKRVKETALRMGAMLPARRSVETRSPRIVKIAPILGA